MLLLSTKTNNKIVRTDERTDGRVVCKIVFSITFNVSFGAQKNRLIVKTLLSTKNVYLKLYKSWFTHYIKTNIKAKHKKAGQGRPASEMP